MEHSENLKFVGNDPGAVRYGNFINYYQFHPVEARISILNNLPEGVLKCPEETVVALDLGCNSGELTAALARFLGETLKRDVRMLGVDIDPNLIERARQNFNQNKQVSFECLDLMSPASIQILNDHLKSVQRDKFHFVFSFSITMWIHLNHGDEGLVSFLKRMSDLAERAVVVEPQPWKCYRTAQRRMAKSGQTFLLYPHLKIKSDIEEEIKKRMEEEQFSCISGAISTEWGRSVLFFVKNHQ